MLKYKIHLYVKSANHSNKYCIQICITFYEYEIL